MHNSGHLTIEAAHCSQFEQHVRCVLGLPLGSTALRVPAAAMINILGAAPTAAELESAGGDAAAAARAATWAPLCRALAVPGASLHWYDKAGAIVPGRKLGHVTITGESAAVVAARVREVLGEGEGEESKEAGSAPALQALSAAAPLVGIIMGSDSDLPGMAAAAAILGEFGVPFELTIVSAHRTPARMVEYAQSARRRGLRVLIAAAGGAAHLPGMVAALTSLPVIGVPIPLKHLDGVDSLHSIVQMPRGVPVATVAIGNSTNGALLAVRMLATHMPALADAMEAYQARMEAEVMGKVDTLARVGWQAYVAGMKK